MYTIANAGEIILENFIIKIVKSSYKVRSKKIYFKIL